MSNKLFSAEEIEILSKNKNVKNVSSKGITYTDEFKEIFISENIKGKTPREIFELEGFDVEILGMERVTSSGKRWRRSYKNNGEVKDKRKVSSGRPSEKELTLEEKYKRLEAKTRLLEAENELLKKMKMLERGLTIKIDD